MPGCGSRPPAGCAAVPPGRAFVMTVSSSQYPPSSAMTSVAVNRSPASISFSASASRTGKSIVIPAM